MGMRYRKVGKWGLQVSEIALGAWASFGDCVKDVGEVKKIVCLAYESGVNFFDNADTYANGCAEELMGSVLAEYPRSTLVLASKAGWPVSGCPNSQGLSRKHLRASLQASLQRLRTDYLDIYFAHRHDPDVPLEEIVTTMSAFVDQGLILYWGTSEWPVARLAGACEFARANGLHPPICEQVDYSILYRKRWENTLAPEAEPLGLGLMATSPLAMGVLTGKYDDGIPPGSRLARHKVLKEALLTPHNLARVRELAAVAAEHGMTRAQLALAWVLRRKELSCAIVGATGIGQLQENLGAAGVVLAPEAVAQIERIIGGKSSTASTT
ncbi:MULTISPECIES: aldo/keto reductase [Thermaceae]|jgi:voltage-dependent potassium channel beta subunit|uniref:Aldo/keto reductase n=5 Tax=Thermaceae TaxID=188786 RepID=D7BA37_ALLS1|nr:MULTISPECIES: aldo/keto reductase [Thermaceae]ADD27328.1 aldo/keto reductase [Meiothermus ruber DSM 1279]ADH62471.1 aldo/keto reductase [Allomeiothermus silvanus DSM 9946]MCL6531424.1 aldo/keto reductase [Meiothermus ruber]PZA07452.1 aldo/keto reductase [Meiothermus sp. Pnk-1]RIH85570.1 L-glyceraldehyde 3-phosphate reductase [Calidithermus roseus]